MKDISKVTACVVDSGLFLNMARRLAVDFDRVLYWNPDCRGFPSLRQASIGDGFTGVERVQEFWDEFDQIDLFVFPDVQCPELQLYLESKGKAVWGARRGMDLEVRREFFLKSLEALGLNVPPHEVVQGITRLRYFLRDKEDYYIKISRYRGDMETHHWRNWSMDRGWLDRLAVSLGPLAYQMRFICCASIETDLEIGGDSYSVDGQWPGLMLNGVEGKDKSYFGAVSLRSEMPAQVLEVMEAFSPLLKGFRYRQHWSIEIRIKGEQAFPTDASTRGGMPSCGSQQMLWRNFSQIIWAGANGELIEPDPAAGFSIETMITASREPETWEVAQIPDELEGHAQFNNCAYIDRCYCFPPCEYGGNELGWLVAIGQTPEETLQRQKDLADLLPDGLNADVEALASVIQEIEKAGEEGIPWNGQEELPAPAEVL